MTSALSFAGVEHRYKPGRSALRDCNVAVPEGRVVALVGPNGAGKTTLLNIAAGLLRPTVGTVHVGGQAPEKRIAHIGYVAQDAPLWPRLRVADVLDIGRCMNPRFDPELAALRIKAFDIPPEARIQSLSGGQRAQVALSMVLAKRADLLLLDEPIANLDPLARREFLTSMFASCAEDGVTVLFSSHAIAELERICDYLIVLGNGRVRVAGDVDDLRADHRVVTGPAHWPERTGLPVVSATQIGDRTVALVRLDAGALIGPGLDQAEPSFDELALGYLVDPRSLREDLPA